jgi:hypothetical protein
MILYCVANLTVRWGAFPGAAEAAGIAPRTPTHVGDCVSHPDGQR